MAPHQGPLDEYLLSGLPNPTGLVELGGGEVAGVRWKYWAQMTPVTGGRSRIGQVTKHDPRVPVVLMSGIGLSTFISFEQRAGKVGVAAVSGPGGDPRRLPKIVLGSSGPGTGLDAKLIIGVTSAPAATIRVRPGASRSSLGAGP